jgi:aminoglycoside phosphotransferase (APT) family kinase protein
VTDQPPSTAEVTAGQPFASGREADVFLLDNGRVLRRYRTGADTAHEAEIMAHAAGHGYPVPAVFSASGPDMVMERLHGPTMAEAALSGELSMEDSAVILADLLRRLHELPPRNDGTDRSGNGSNDGGNSDGDGDKTSGDGDGDKGSGDGSSEGSSRSGSVSQGSGGSGGRRGARRTEGGGRETIVHLDLHPDNIVLTGRGPVVIDWRNAGDGPGDLDTALSALILAQVAIGSIEHPLGAAVDAMLDRFLALAPGDPVRLLDEAAAYRRQQLTMSPAEISMIGTAAARVRAGIR